MLTLMLMIKIYYYNKCLTPMIKIYASDNVNINAYD